MLLSVLKKIPFLQSLFFFPWQSHTAALRKFIALWLLSSSPVILAILLSPIPDGDISLWGKLLAKISDAISVSEQFVYAAAFLSPVLYIIYERYASLESEDHFGIKMAETARSVFKGYWLVSISAIVVLLLTVSAYSANKINTVDFQATFLYRFATDSAPWLYLYALFCWYLSILDGFGGGGDFIATNRDNEEELATNFSNRIQRRD